MPQQYATAATEHYELQVYANKEVGVPLHPHANVGVTVVAFTK